MQACITLSTLVFMTLIRNSSSAFFLQDDQEMSDALLRSSVIQSDFDLATSEILQTFHNSHDDFYHNESTYDRKMQSMFNSTFNELDQLQYH